MIDKIILKLIRITGVTLICSLWLQGCGETPTSQLSEQFPIIRSGPYGMEFAFIPKGTFRMGSPKDEDRRYSNETRHWVKLTDDYWMQTTEVTMGQWRKVMGSYPDTDDRCRNSDSTRKGDTYPAVCINMDDMDLFIKKLNDLERNSGYRYRLPTEAQWEYATRAYTETPFSLDQPLELFSWYYSSSDGHAHPVGKLKANFFGLYDVHGNVSEPVTDWYAEYPETKSYADAVVNPEFSTVSTNRVWRGGAWLTYAWGCRSAFREGDSVPLRRNDFGFRLMRMKI